MYPRVIWIGRFLAVLKYAHTQKLGAGSAVHLALDKLQPVYLPFDMTLASRQSKSSLTSVDVPFAEDAEEARGKLSEPTVAVGSQLWSGSSRVAEASSARC